MVKIGGQKVPSKTLLLVASDVVIIVVGLLTAVAMRLFNGEAVLSYLRSPNTFARLGWAVLAWELALYYNDLYNSQAISRRAELFIRLLQALGTAYLLLGISYYIYPDLSLGRGVAALSAPTILILTLSWRLVLDAAGRFLYDRERMLVVGTGPDGISLVREIVSRPELNLQVVGFLDEKGGNVGKPLVNPGIIGSVSDVVSVVGKEKIDRVILSLAERRGQTPVRQLLQLKFAGVPIEEAHSFNERIAGRILLEHLSPSWLILSEGFRKSTFLAAAKRTVDILVSLVALILTLPVMALIAVAIWLETGSPILFLQKRTGLGGCEFEMLKFRSMYHSAEENGPSWAANNDRRITRVGRFIRKYRLDELPQMLNVLRGEMSLVGPRPERPYFCRTLEEQIPFFVLRYSVRPGITGWAQIKYRYGSNIEEAKTKLEYDLFYVKHLSLLLDLAILFETAKVIFWGRGAK